MEFPDSYFEDEVREGFYIPSLMKRAWAAQMEVLGIVDTICERHGIRYFAEWGTLLGAVRHGGRIPWDDDIDICMLREDYDRFRGVVEEELPEECMFWDYHNTEDFEFILGRIVNSRVHVVEGKLLEKYHGFPYVAGIDIFWLDDLPSEEEEDKRYLEEVRAIYFLLYGIRESRNKDHFLSPKELEFHIKRLEQLCHVRIHRKKPLEKQLFALLDEKTRKVVQREMKREVTNQYIWRNNPNYRLPKANYETPVKIPFENIRIRVPSGYEDILTRKYGGNWRVPVRSGGLHDYPSYAKQQKFLEEEQAAELYEYKYSPDDVQAIRKKRLPRKTLQGKVQELLVLFQEAHQEIGGKIRQMDTVPVLSLLAQCQETAIQIGSLVEKKEHGDRNPVIIKLEGYCEEIFQIHERIMSGTYNPDVLADEFEERMSGTMKELSRLAARHLGEEKVIVFVPYKPCFWKSMETAWRAAVGESGTRVYVVPAPYYYKDAYGRAKTEEMHYETDGYPEEVTLTFYEGFPIQSLHPDEIVIQCPYDEYNYGFTVHPFFYARNLLPYTEKLIYIPALEMDEIGPEDDRAMVNLKSYCNMPGVVYADEVRVSSENIKKNYVALLTGFAGEETREIWNKKIICQANGSDIP